jgi:hypothetical protein
MDKGAPEDARGGEYTSGEPAGSAGRWALAQSAGKSAGEGPGSVRRRTRGGSEAPIGEPNLSQCPLRILASVPHPGL